MKRNKFLTLFAAVLMLLSVQSVNAMSFTLVTGSDPTGNEGCAALMDGAAGTKWGSWAGWYGNSVFAVFKAALPIAVADYELVIANDTPGSPGRNWKKWRVFGGNFSSDADATKDAEGWVLLDEKDEDVPTGDENESYLVVPYTLSNATTDSYAYFMIIVDELAGGWGEYCQMGEFRFVNEVVDTSGAQEYLDYEPTGVDEDLIAAYNDKKAELLAAYSAANVDAIITLSGEIAQLKAKIETIKNGGFIALYGSSCWGDGHYSQLVDGKENTKWGGNFSGNVGDAGHVQYIVFRGLSQKPFFYKLVTGNDTATNTGRNWKSWTVFGGNFASEAEATKDAEGWVALDIRTNISAEYLPMKNFYPATFDFTEGVATEYAYFKVEVYESNGTQQQMSEMYLCSQEEFEAIRAPYVEELAEFAAGLDEYVVESDKEELKDQFATLFTELQTTADAVRLTKVYNDLVALKEQLEESHAFATGGYRPIDGSAGWGDGHYSQLIDGNINTKWGGGIPDGGAYIIFKAYAANQFPYYELITGSDTERYSGRNWKTWKIYGTNVKGDMDDTATRDFAGWTLIDQKTDIGQDLLPAANFAPAYFTFSETWPAGYKYFKIEVESAFNGTAIQMSEFKMLSEEAFAAIRQEYVDSLQKVGAELYEQFAGLPVPDAIKNQVIAAATAKVTAVATATPEQLMPLFNEALQYITVDLPAMATLEQNEGVYEIDNAIKLVLFKELVNGGEADANAVLTADIDMTGYDWTPIGNADLMYSGTFDGQGYKITNFSYTATGNNNGLFGAINNATVQNFGIYGTLTSDGFNYNGTIGQAEGTPIISGIYSALDINVANFKAHTGGIVGGMTTASTMEIHKCEYAGTLTHTGLGDCQAGIVGYTYGGGVFDCVFSGTIIGENNKYGGIMGYCKVPAFKGIQNCLSIGKIVADEGCTTAAAILANWNGNATTSIKNNYYLLQEGSTTTIAIGNKATNCEAPVLVTAEQLASGEITFKLNNGEVEDVAWYQNLDKRAFKAEQYVVTADGTAEEPTAADVTLTNAADGTYTFTLPNFTLNILGMSLPVGDISLTGVEIADDGTFSQTGTYAVPAENIPAALATYAAFFQSIPYTLTGKVNEEKLYAVIDLTVNVGTAHTVNVVVGTDDFEAVAPALAEGDAYPVLDATHAIVYEVGTLHCDGTPYGDAGSGKYTNDIADFPKDEHDFVGGFCTYCSIADENYEGVYEIANAAQLVSFATLVNTKKAEADAILVSNIDMTGVAWEAPIGDWSVSGINSAYKGHFDGQGYFIDNLVFTVTKNFNGLFGVISGATVENFEVYGTITNASYQTIGGAVGFARDGSPTIRNVRSFMDINNTYAGARIGGILGHADNVTTTVDRCWYSGTINTVDEGGGGNYGGIIGYTNNNAACTPVISNCLFDGAVMNTADSPGNCTFGGVVGYTGANPTVTVKNCLSIGVVSSKIAGQFFGAVKSTKCSIVNSYYTGDVVNGPADGAVTLPTLDATQVDNAQLASGFVASRLLPAFRQEIGTNAYPVLYATLPIVAEITEAGYATLYQEETDVEIPEGVEAFTGMKNGRWLILDAVEGAIAAEEPVVLKGAAGFYMFAPTTGATKAEANDLIGTAENIAATGQYVLAQPEGEELAFYRATTGTIRAGKAYLEDASGIKAFFFGDDDATGINGVEMATENGAIYNVAGQRLNKMQKGINIVAGKKVLK